MLQQMMAEVVIRERDQEIQRAVRRNLARQAMVSARAGARKGRPGIGQAVRAWFGRIRRSRVQVVP